MIRWLTILLALAATPWAQETAERALDDGLPSLAAREARAIWEKTADPAAGALLARSLVALGDFRGAVDVLRKLPSLDGDKTLLLAEALAGAGRITDALDAYRKAEAFPDCPDPAAARIGTARMLAAQGDLAAADNELATLSDPRATLDRAAIALDQNNPQRALDVLAAKVPDTAPQKNRWFFLSAAASFANKDPETALAQLARIDRADARLATDSTLLRADIQASRGDRAAAEEALESFIDSHPANVFLPEVFARLDDVYEHAGGEASSEFRRWSRDDAHPEREALAAFYLARSESRAGKSDRARKLFADFLAAFPDDPLAADARIEAARLALAADDPTGVLAAIGPAGRSSPDAAFLEGTALAAQGDFAAAADAFLSSARLRPNSAALANAALCSLAGGAEDTQNVGLNELLRTAPDSPFATAWPLVRALDRATLRDPTARDALQKLADGPLGHKARLALAEFAYAINDQSAARAEFRKISSVDPSDRDRAEALGVFLADTGDPSSDADVIRLAEGFLTTHPSSPHEAEVRMKLGEVLFRKGDFLAARAQFDLVNTRSPDSPLAQPALFFSAQALSRSLEPTAREEAIALYEEVARAGGPFAAQARLSQATLLNALGQPTEALAVLDRLLESLTDPDLRARTLIEKGDTLFALGPKDPADFHRAIAVWKILADDASTNPAWRNQALARIGAAQEKLGDTSAAIASYYEVVSRAKPGDVDYLWFSKAGFDAGRLLESLNNWSEAIAMYEKVAAIEGPRAREARDRIARIRLENFLWDE